MENHQFKLAMSFGEDSGAGFSCVGPQLTSSMINSRHLFDL